MEGKIKGTSLSVLSKHLCGIMIALLFFGERLQFLGIPYYGYAMIAFAIVRLWDNHFIIRRGGLRRFSFNNLSSFGLFWILVASVMLTISFRTAGIRPYTYVMVTCLTILIVSLTTTQGKDIELLMKYAMLGVFVTVIATGYELYTGSHLFQFNEYYTRIGRNSAFGFQVNPNDNATVLVVCIFIVLFFIKKYKILSTILIFIIVSMITRTGARLAIYSIIVLGIEALILIGVSRISEKHTGLSRLVNAFIFVFLSILIGFSFSTESFLQVFSSPQEYLIDYNRFMLMRSALETITPFSFFFGKGAGVTMIKIGYLNIHSVLVEILCDYGIIVITWLVYFVLKLFFSYTDNISKSKKILFPCFATSFVILCFESSSMLRIHPIWMLLAVMWEAYQLELKK